MGNCIYIDFNDSVDQCADCHLELSEKYYLCDICRSRYHEKCILRQNGFCCHQKTNVKIIRRSVSES